MKRMRKFKNLFVLMFVFLFLLFVSACNNSANQKVNDAKDSSVVNKDTTATSTQKTNKDTITVSSASKSSIKESASFAEKPTILIYNFYVTNRCPSCIASEEATTKTLNTYFAAEVKQGRIKRQILNVDDDANKKISEKYQAFGSSLFVVRVLKGKETTTDLTGDGFKFAKNKEEKFIEILKETITKALK